MRTQPQFIEHYGPWAVVAGASEGLGEAFAEALARRGINVVLLARRAQLLERLAARLSDTYGVSAVPVVLDLTSADVLQKLEAALIGRDVGLLIYNAAYAPVGSLLERTDDELQRLVALNVLGPLRLTRYLLPSLATRGRGGVVLMSSLAGNQGTPRLAPYAASKAFNTVLAEGLWSELGEAGVDVLACTAGAIRTPGYARTEGGDEAPGTLDAADVADAALDGLGAGPRVIPGWVNRLATLFMGRVVPRRTAIAIMHRSTRSLS